MTDSTAGTPATQSYRDGVRRFTAYRFVSRLSFYVPVLVVALLALERSLTEVGLLLAVYGLATSFCGGMAKRALARSGAKATLITGEVLKGIAAVLLWATIGRIVPEALLTRPLGMLPGTGETALLMLAQVIGGIGYSFAATADGTILASLGRLAGAGDDHRAAESRSSSLMFIAFLGAGIVGGVVAMRDLSLPFAMTAVAHLLAIAAVSRLQNPAAPARPAGSAPQASAAAGHDAVGYARPALLVPMVFYAGFRALVLAVQIVLMPIILFLDYQLSIALFGLVFAAYTLTGFFAGRFYARLHEKLGDRWILLITVLCQVGSLIALAEIPSLLVVLAPIPMFFVAGMLRPFALPRLNAAARQDAHRPRIVGAAERLFGLFNALIVAGIGVSADLGVSRGSLLWTLAAISLVLGLALLAMLRTDGQAAPTAARP